MYQYSFGDIKENIIINKLFFNVINVKFYNGSQGLCICIDQTAIIAIRTPI